ncbi:MAG: calcium/sodium antiporter [Treponema sp.]|nr:calcium/sodium antiporter [Treponema sp.]
MVFLQILFLVLGFGALVKGADIFVDGSVSLAHRFRVSSLLIGLTIVAFGTSMPELAVSTTAALQEANEIALSNIVGSNIFNLLVILGLCAIIRPLPVDSALLRYDIPFSLIVTFFSLIVIAFHIVLGGTFFSLEMEAAAGSVTRPFAVTLLVLFTAYLVYLIYDARKNLLPKEKKCLLPPLWKNILFIAVGLVLIIAGGEAVVYAARNIAQKAGMSETLIGLTIVAIGTSLPELITSIVASRKGENALAVGNIIGSNIFNLLFILGISAVIRPVTVNVASIYDLAILTVVTAVSFIFALSKKTISRKEGFFMLVLYIAATIFAAIR